MLIDTTLREGAQMFETYVPHEARIAIAGMIADMGVEEIEVGWIGQNGLAELIAALRRRGVSSDLSAWSPCRPVDVYRAAGLGLDTVSIGLPVSDLHIAERLRTDRAGLTLMLRETVGTAHSCGIRRISIGLEDVTRADQGFALAMARMAEELGAARIRLADTLGVMTPERIAELVRFFANGVDMEIAVHCHNDFGMATANAITALAAGAHWADVSVLGIGERSGISALEEVAGHLRLVQGYEIYDMRGVREVCDLVAELARIPVARNRPVAGEDIFAAESGLHVDGILKNPALFEPYDPQQTGARRILALGAKAGRGAVKAVLGQMGLNAPLHRLNSLVDTIRERAANSGRPLKGDEVQALLKCQECLDDGA
ncbi:MAG: pyruvate carboxyltransferase [Deltaproteobacteria bacterium]|nr:pyruvate carboxyltransferase [Deltaproteobacteria bacterium]